MTDLGRGAIGIPCREVARFTAFWQCVMRLKMPEGYTLVGEKGKPEPIVRCNNSVAQARNEITEIALEQGADWIFFLDDDLIFSSDVLQKLHARHEPIVIGLTLMRMTNDGNFWPIWSNQPTRRNAEGKVFWESVHEITPGPNGLMPLVSGTGGGVLTRREVFEVMARPWWAMGQHDPEMFWEDIYFYEAAAKAGIQVWGDPTVHFGHYQMLVQWPMQKADGSWHTVLAHGFDGFIQMPWPVYPPALVTA